MGIYSLVFFLFFNVAMYTILKKKTTFNIAKFMKNVLL